MNRIYTSGIAFRDDLVRLALHAGYAARFDIHYKADDHRGYKSSEPFEAQHDHWQATQTHRRRDTPPHPLPSPIPLSTRSVRRSSLTVLSVRCRVRDVSYSDWPAAAEPILYNQRDIKEVKEPTGAPVPVWCVTVPPHHLIIARRVRKNDSGVVTLASKPLVVGNCHNDLQEGNLILEANAHRHDRTKRRKRSRAIIAAAAAADSALTTTAGTASGISSHKQSTTEQLTDDAESERAARSVDSLSVPHRPSSLVVDVTHRPSPSPQPARQVSVAADVSFDELQHLMHSPLSPLSPESPAQTADGSSALLRDSLDALQLDQHQQFNALLVPDSPFDLPHFSRTLSGSSASSAVCSSPFSGWRLHMIDFEYSSYNPRAFDLANHVCEHYIDYAHDQWPGFIIKQHQFPSEHHIRRFITAYLHHYKKYTVRAIFNESDTQLPPPQAGRHIHSATPSSPAATLTVSVSVPRPSVVSAV